MGPRFVGGGDISQILDMRFQIAVTCEHVADFGRVPFSKLGDYAAKKRRMPVKYKSADAYVGWQWLDDIANTDEIKLSCLVCSCVHTDNSTSFVLDASAV